MVSFKKTGTKKKKKIRRKKTDDADTAQTANTTATTATTTPQPSDSKKDDDDIGDEDEADFYETLSRFKKENQRAAASTTNIAAAVAAAAQKRAQEEQTSGGLVISSTTEFVRNLKVESATEQQTVPKRAKEPIKEEMDVDKKEEGELEDMEAAPTTDQPQDEGAAPILPEEPLVSNGIAATLKLIAQKGGIDPFESYAGRKNDKLPERDEATGVHLDYFDEYGRKMTPKEAFRHLSHRFHGKKPGKNKQEKKLKQMQEDMKRRQSMASDNSLATLEHMQKQQMKTRTPYIVLSGNAHANHETSVKPEPAQPASTGFTEVEIKKEEQAPLPGLSGLKVEFGISAKRKAPKDSDPQAKREKAD